MTEEEAFLSAIYAAPDDDVPRLVYSDWLEERGQAERAELIRLQCRMAREEPCTEDEGDREFSLVEQYRQAWSAHLPQVGEAVWRFRRGFPEELEIGLDAFLGHYEVLSAVPRIRYLVLIDATSSLMCAFARRTWNAEWVGLQLYEEPKPWLHTWPFEAGAGIAALVSSPQAARLRELCFPLYRLDDDGIRALCESPYLDGLTLLGVELDYLKDSRLLKRFGARLHPSFTGGT